MARGMELYSHRTPNESGITALHTLEDLQRYCYYVAGTVGHMLTELFVAEMQDGSPERARNMRENAESFGLALQLVNILKDVTDDRERGVSFIPRTLCEAQGISVEQLLQPEHRAEAHGAVRPIFEVAERMLDRALTYTLAIPPSEQGMRLFCLLPLWMAVRTLVIAKGNDGMFIADRPVKITRDEVERLIADCVQHCSQDDALRSHYAALWSPMALTQALGEAESSQQELH
jgi:farnesyl-diphosphate farnesyltransferase